MLIKSPENDTYLQFERTDTDEYLEVTVTACIGGFVASTGTWFFDAQQFLVALSEFERSRRSGARLASDAFTLSVEPRHSTGAAQIRFRLCHSVDYFGGVISGTPSPSGMVTIEGEFHLSGEFIGQLLHDFTALLRREPCAQ